MNNRTKEVSENVLLEMNLTLGVPISILFVGHDMNRFIINTLLSRVLKNPVYLLKTD